jgi:hypothetical protein
MSAVNDDDGSKFLSVALYGKRGQPIPLSIAIPWNTAILGICYMSAKYHGGQFNDYEANQMDKDIALTIDCTK